MNGRVSASPLPSAGPLATTDPMDGQRPARQAEVGRLGLAFQRLLREAESGKPAFDTASAKRGRYGGHDEGTERTEGAAADTSGISRTRSARSTNSLEDSGEDPFALTRPESACNDAPQRPEPAVRWLATLDTTSTSGWTSDTAPDPREMGATRAALEASLMNPVSTPESRAAAPWEVSLPLASGTAIELQATRPQTSAGATAWNLGIRSGARDLTSAFVRTSSRLIERLEARSLSAHVRIERDERKPEP